MGTKDSKLEERRSVESVSEWSEEQRIPQALLCTFRRRVPRTNGFPTRVVNDSLPRPPTPPPRKTIGDMLNLAPNLIHRAASTCLLGDTCHCRSIASRDHEPHQQDKILTEVFDIVDSLKRLYTHLDHVSLPHIIHDADAQILREFTKLDALRRRTNAGRVDETHGKSYFVESERKNAVATHYESTINEMKSQLKANEEQIRVLRNRLNRTPLNQLSTASKGSFEVAMRKVEGSSRMFASLLLTLMRTAQWDIRAAMLSIEAATPSVLNQKSNAAAIENHHAEYALESYVSRKLFQGFDRPCFDIASLRRSTGHFRQQCRSQYHDLKDMDPSELLGLLPSCEFGRFCAQKYLAIVNPKMEESLFGELEQRQTVLCGRHPRTQFYNEFLKLSKAVWILHLISFSSVTSPKPFEVLRGAEFDRLYMDSVIETGNAPARRVVAFPVIPGFTLANGTVVKARVFLVSET